MLTAYINNKKRGALMKFSTIKKIDNLGRIVIPKEHRERLMLEKRVEVVLTKDGVLIRNPEYKLVKKENTQE